MTCGRGRHSATREPRGIVTVDQPLTFPRETQLYPEARISQEIPRAIRQKLSARITADLEAGMRTERPMLSRGNDLTIAMDYLPKRWTDLTQFLDDGRNSLSNNAAERNLRHCVRKKIVAVRRLGSQRSESDAWHWATRKTSWPRQSHYVSAVKKYERWVNHLSADRLFEMELCCVPVNYFYEGLCADGKSESTNSIADLSGTCEAMELEFWLRRLLHLIPSNASRWRSSYRMS